VSGVVVYKYLLWGSERPLLLLILVLLLFFF
jgi:hypothetical protein